MKIEQLDIGRGLILAPIAGVTGLPFRMISKQCGADLVYTEMISAAALIRSPGRSECYFMSRDDARPVAAQIFGADPDEMAHAAAFLSDEPVDLIDINMGCPVKKVVRSGAGAALLQDRSRALAIIRAVVRASRRPVTVKLRSGWDASDFCAVEMAQAAEAAGVSAVTLHPRTRAQVFRGRSDWGHIRQLKEAVTIPVIGNGDVRTPQDAKRMLCETGCDGVMIGRAALGNPWLFGRIRSFLMTGEEPPPTDPQTIGDTLIEHLRLEASIAGQGRAVLRMRKFAAWYSRGLHGAAAFRNRINGITGYPEFYEAVTDYFSMQTVRFDATGTFHGRQQERAF